RVYLSAQLSNKIAGRLRRATGRQKIVDNQHVLSLVHRVIVDLESVGAVFEIVLGAQRFRWQFSDFADRREPCTDTIGHGGAKNESPTLDADDDVDPGRGERRRQAVDRIVKAFRILEQRGDVVKE